MLSGWWCLKKMDVEISLLGPPPSISAIAEFVHSSQATLVHKKLGNAKVQEVSSGTTKSLWIQGCACQEQTGAWPKQPHSSTLVTSDHFLITSVTCSNQGWHLSLVAEPQCCLSRNSLLYLSKSSYQNLKWPPASMPRSPRTFSASPS